MKLKLDGSQEAFLKFIEDYRVLAKKALGGNFVFESDFLPYLIPVHGHLEEVLKSLAPGAKILDIGCGRGQYAAYLSQRGLNVKGVEVQNPKSDDDLVKDPAAIKRYRKIWSEAKRRYGPEIQYFDGTHFKFPKAHFDAVLFYASFEHVPVGQIRELCAEANRILKPGGRFFIFRCPSQLAWTEHLAAALGMGHHEKLYGRAEIEGILKANGFKISNFSRADFFPEHVMPIQGFLNRHVPLLQFLDRMVNLTPLGLFSHHLKLDGVKVAEAVSLR